MRPLNIGVVGCGDVALTRHLPTLKENRDVFVSVVCDTLPERARAAAEQFDVPSYVCSPSEIFRNPVVDAVVIATPPWVTPDLAVEALTHGKYVLCEKPMAIELEEAQRVAMAEAQSEGRLQMGFVFRHDPLLAHLQGWIAEGLLGSPLVFRLGIFDETYDPQENPEHYRRIAGTLRHGGPSVHDGAHAADLLNLLTSSPVSGVDAYGIKSRPEFAAPNFDISIIRFQNGDCAKVEIGWFYPMFPASQFEVLGPSGFAEYDWQGRRLRLVRPEGSKELTDSQEWWKACFQGQLKQFVQSVRTKGSCMPGPAEGIYSLRLTQLIRQSIERGEGKEHDR